MDFYCTSIFQQHYLKLLKNNSYRDLEAVLIQFLSNDSPEAYKRGVKLNTSNPHNHYVKVRLGGRSGYRLYFYLVVLDGKGYLGFIHPKTGKKGIDNINDDFKTEILNQILSGIKNNEMISISIQNGCVVFTPN